MKNIEDTKISRAQKYIQDVEETADYILEGHILEEAAKKFGVKTNTIKSRIEALNDVSKDTYNLKKYAEVKNILDSFDAKTKQEKEKQLELEKEKILTLFRKGHSLFETKQFLGIHSLTEEIYKGLNDSESPYYEPETYKFIEETKQEKFENNKNNIVKNNKKTKLEKSVFKTFSLGLRKEIMLMALTYRLSFKTIAKMFGTAVEDVPNLMNGIYQDMYTAMNWLDMETKYESFRFEIFAYKNAKKYWDERNRIRKEIKENKMTKEDLKEHHKQIDDTVVMSLVGKNGNSLTEEEKEKVVRYRLKYGYSHRKAEGVTGFNYNAIASWEQNLSEKDVIFREKVEQLNSYNFNEYMRNNFQHAEESLRGRI